MDSVRQHWATFRELARERRFRTPLLLVWMSNFGASLASPALPFFYLRLGLTPVEIGRQAAILAAGTLVTAPAYGWLLDARGPFASIALSASLCGVGCLLRGLARGARLCVCLLYTSPSPRDRG